MSTAVRSGSAYRRSNSTGPSGSDIARLPLIAKHKDVARVADQVDRWSLWMGRYLRNNAYARLYFLVYLSLLHGWVGHASHLNPQTSTLTLHPSSALPALPALRCLVYLYSLATAAVQLMALNSSPPRGHAQVFFIVMFHAHSFEEVHGDHVGVIAPGVMVGQPPINPMNQAPPPSLRDPSSLGPA